MTHVGGFGSFLWKCYLQRQTLPLDPTSQATKPPSHVQHGSLCFCQPEAPMGDSPSMEGTGSKGGIRVFSIGSSLGGSNFKNMEKERFGDTFCSLPHWWMILKGFCTLLPKNWEVFGTYPCTTQQCPDAQCSEQHLPG